MIKKLTSTLFLVSFCSGKPCFQSMIRLDNVIVIGLHKIIICFEFQIELIYMHKNDNAELMQIISSQKNVIVR